MADPVGLVSLIYQLSKDLYEYYQIAKDRDSDISELRARALELQEKAVLVKKALKREGLQTEDKANVEKALRRCEGAAQKLKDRVQEFPPKSQPTGKTASKLKSWFNNAIHKVEWPFQKPTIAAFTTQAKVCESALTSAIALLDLNVGVTSIEDLRRLDKRVVDNSVSAENAMKDLRCGIENQFQRLSEELSKQTKMLADSIAAEEAEKFLNSLRDPDFESRQMQIVESHDKTYELFNNGAQDYPQAAELLDFLKLGTGIFWITGEAASGKSTLMKHLSSPKRPDGNDIWVWLGATEVTIARHFCWITGTDDQKSQSAMLRSLLRHVLSEETHLIPHIKHLSSGKAAYYNSWRVANLWSCLHAAIEKSSRRICFFIDGLDEIEIIPGSTHEDLVSKLQDLSAVPKVKMIVSSRPWTAFQGLEIAGRTLRIESLNSRPIVDYLRETLAVHKTFSDVSWGCLYTSWNSFHHKNLCREHNHGNAHGIVLEVIQKADGNFLYTTLVTETVRERLKAGFNILEMRDYINKMPPGIKNYLRDSILRRTSDTWRHQKPVFLKIATLTLSWIPFWIHRNSNSESVSPAVAGPASLCVEYSGQKIREMMQETKMLLSECCRDILDLRDLSDCIEADHYHFAWRWWDIRLSFRHRTIFDFLQTRDMQEFLTANTPPYFHTSYCGTELEVAQWTVNVSEGFQHPDYMSMCFGDIARAITEIHGESLIPRKSAAKAEKVCLEQLHTAFRSGNQKHFTSIIGLVELCYRLAAYDLFDITDTLCSQYPWVVGGFDAGGGSMLAHICEEPPYILTDTQLLEKVLDTGADPNEHFHNWRSTNKSSWTTYWCSLLESLNSMAVDSHSGEGRSDSDSVGPDDPDAYTIKGTSGATFFSTHVQAVLKLFLQHGAELDVRKVETGQACDHPDCNFPHRQKQWEDTRLDPLATLRSWLPMNENSEWPGLLETCSQPSKQKELREAQRALRAKSIAAREKWEQRER